MSTPDLALFGGSPVRLTEFSSRPWIDQREIDVVTGILADGQLSQFVGSPIEGTRKALARPSRELVGLEGGWSFLGGQYVRRFEAAWSDVVGADFSVSMNSATSGLITALLALDLEPGSEVITTPFSFTATAAAIVLANCVPVFVDIDPETFCISPEALERAVNAHTRAVVPVHWCGNAGDFDALLSVCRRHDLRVIEDAAQTPATWYGEQALGTLGDLGVYSFNQPKNLMTGEGGIVVTNDRHLAEKCRLIRNHGEAIVDDDDDDQYVVNTVGYNFRLTEIQAAIGCVQIEKLEEIHSIRATNYAYLADAVQQRFSDYLSPQRITHPDSYYAYTAAFRWHEERSGVPRNIVGQALRAEGVPVFTGYQRLLCDHPMFKRKLAAGLSHHPWHGGYYHGDVDYDNLQLPNARRLVDHEFLGFMQIGWPNETDDMNDIVRAFEKIVDNVDLLRTVDAESPHAFQSGK